MAGLDDSGFSARRAADLRDTIEGELQARLDTTLDFGRDTAIGQIVAVLATLLGDLEEAIQAVYDARDLNNATGIQLDNIARINGLTREPATRTETVVNFDGDIGSPVAQFETIVEDSDALRFRTLRDARIGAAAIFVTPIDGDTYDLELYEGGTLVATATVVAPSGSTAELMAELVAEEARREFPPEYSIYLHGAQITVERDDGAQFSVSATGLEFQETNGRSGIRVEAVEAGELTPVSPGINAIVTPVDGVTSVLEYTALRIVGQDLESDDQLRARIVAAQQSRGSVSTAAITANILDDVVAVDSALTIENDQNSSQTVQGITLSANSIRTYIHPSTLSSDDEAAVLRTIYETRAVGIETDASDVTGTVQDASQTEIAYDYASTLGIAVTVTVTLASGFSLSEVEDEYEEAIRAYLDQLAISEDVSDLQVKSRGAAIEGIVRIDTIYDDSGGNNLGINSDVLVDTDTIAIPDTITVTT